MDTIIHGGAISVLSTPPGGAISVLSTPKGGADKAYLKITQPYDLIAGGADAWKPTNKAICPTH